MLGAAPAAAAADMPEWMLGGDIRAEESAAGDGTYLFGISASSQLTVAEVLEMVPSEERRHTYIVRANNMLAEDDELIATGMRLNYVIPNSFDSDEIEFAVAGDVTGSGRITLTQLVRMSSALRKSGVLKGVYAAAADRNENGRLDLTDLVIQASDLAGEPGAIPQTPSVPAQTVRPAPAVTSSPVPTSSPTAALPDSPAGLLAFVRQEALSRANALRAKKDLGALSESALLDDAAQVNAERLAWYGDDILPVPLKSLVRIPSGSSAESHARIDYVPVSALSGAMMDVLGETSALLSSRGAYAGFGAARNSFGQWVIYLVVTPKDATEWAAQDKKPNGWTEEYMGEAEVENWFPAAQEPWGPVVSTPTPEPDYSVPVPNAVHTMMEAAVAEVGKPYLLGASGPDEYDCSGFVYKVLRAAGSKVDRMSSSSYANLSSWKTISRRAELRTGDLLFFGTRDAAGNANVTHVGIYMGNGNMIHSAPSVNGVGYGTISLSETPLFGFFDDGFLWAKRVFE